MPSAFFAVRLFAVCVNLFRFIRSHGGECFGKGGGKITKLYAIVHYIVQFTRIVNFYCTYISDSHSGQRIYKSIRNVKAWPLFCLRHRLFVIVSRSLTASNERQGISLPHKEKPLFALKSPVTSHCLDTKKERGIIRSPAPLRLSVPLSICSALRSIPSRFPLFPYCSLR